MAFVDVALWWTDLRTADLSVAATLPAAERERLHELSDQTERGRRLAGALLLQHAVRQARALDSDEPVEIDRTCSECGAQHGRPVVADGLGPHVSVSHSGLVIAVATCAEAAVGVDVERLAPDTPPATAAELRDWVEHEARMKAALAADETATIQPLTCPFEGYVAALAVATPSGIRVREHFLQ
ncbi:hypothetical protein LKO27_12080 [Tessaracoccus sp. OS52]|uniref:4'-phosphopantetheinyl transferase family protein n=1 Tax=Tessaracoccus sp. OS52 TaxID=2886691 RepID=UPI001D11ACE8|nr:hypothetical protein [Tessaracoccus sp. OS52]MCC2594145.1 hypothetical protein [Tessaracoccus sp. OS52]